MRLNECIERIQSYHQSFYASDWLKKVSETEEAERRLSSAKRLLHHDFVFQKTLDMEPCSASYHYDDIDWESSANGDPEWTFMLNRHEYLEDLVSAYQLTGQLRYLSCWKELMFDWIEKAGDPEGREGTAWRTLDTGIRCGSWMRCIAALARETPFSEQEWKKFTDSVKRHVVYIFHAYKDRYTLSNWGILQMGGALSSAMFFPGLLSKQQESWMWETFKKQFETQFYSDGVHWEQSPLYHIESLFSYLQVAIHAYYFKINTPFAIMESLKQPSLAAFFMELPDGRLLAQNDSDSVMIHKFNQLLYALDLLPVHVQTVAGDALFTCGSQLIEDHNRKTYSALSSATRKKPVLFKGYSSGNIFYKEHEDYFSIFNGRHGSGHGHGMLGHVNLVLKKQPVLVDCGRFTYREDSSVRPLLKEMKSHNTIVVDHDPAVQPVGSWSFKKMGDPLSVQSEASEQAVVAEIIYCGQLDRQIYVHKRICTFIRHSGIFLMTDSIACPGRHLLTKYFHFDSGLSISETGQGWKLTAGDKKFYFTIPNGRNNYKSETGKLSPVYHQLHRHWIIKEDTEFHDRYLSTVALSSGELTLTANDLLGEGPVIKKDLEKICSFEIQDRTGSLWNYYYIGEDSASEVPLYLHRKRPIYGKVVLIQDHECRRYL